MNWCALAFRFMARRRRLHKGLVLLGQGLLVEWEVSNIELRGGLGGSLNPGVDSSAYFVPGRTFDSALCSLRVLDDSNAVGQLGDRCLRGRVDVLVACHRRSCCYSHFAKRVRKGVIGITAAL